jgi:hypothetical protein
MASTPARWLRLQLDDLERSHIAADARRLGRLPELA